jgi:hypothetical protein
VERKELEITPEMIDAGADVVLELLYHDPLMSPGLASELAEKVLRGALSTFHGKRETT